MLGCKGHCKRGRLIVLMRIGGAVLSYVTCIPSPSACFHSITLLSVNLKLEMLNK